ncbi:GNAT family N-acetyltransferase [Candidatus Collierbacteria bacterium]|nr:GNAT family N-acetyltransferase [Candidatus Collierbacteria bacterium]
MLEIENVSNKWVQQIKSWVEDDAEGKKRLGYLETPGKLLTLINNTSRYGWIVKEEGVAVGLIDFEVTNKRGSFVIYLAPQFRGKGYARRLLDKIVEIAKERQLETLYAGVEPDNEPSVRSLKSSGFRQVGKDKDGMLEFEMNVDSISSDQ